MIVQNGQVFMQNGHFACADLKIEEGIISSIQEPGTIMSSTEEIIDAQGLYVIPGLIDIHTHAAAGCDFSNGIKEELIRIAEYERSVGVSSFCPTSMTLGKEVLERAFICAREMIEDDDLYENGRARILGINMEGPFISEEKAGAQNVKYIVNPDVDMFRDLNKISGDNILLVTIAPEIDGAFSFIHELKDEVHISLGHTMADYEITERAFMEGADHVTHLFNAMEKMTHREPGPVSAALNNGNIYVEIICDGHHIHPGMIQSVFNMFDEDRIILISDSMEGTGMPDGEYMLGGQKVFKRGHKAVLDNGKLAGSVSNLFDCFKYAVDLGIPLEKAIKAATINPAKSIGADMKVGVIKENAFADILLLDEKLNIVRII